MSADEANAIVAARQAAERGGYQTQGLDAEARRVGDIWEVSFFKVVPDTRGGPGFMVRLRIPTLEVMDIRSFQ